MDISKVSGLISRYCGHIVTFPTLPFLFQVKFCGSLRWLSGLVAEGDDHGQRSALPVRELLLDPYTVSRGRDKGVGDVFVYLCVEFHI